MRVIADNCVIANCVPVEKTYFLGLLVLNPCKSRCFYMLIAISVHLIYTRDAVDLVLAGVGARRNGPFGG
jgi:hypothetical protein